MACKPTHATEPIGQPDGSYLVPLSQDMYARIDARDVKRVRSRTWHAAKDKHTYYALASSKKSDGRRSTIRMHRLILDPGHGMEIDHCNGNGLDNRRSNIRVCSHAQNSHNQRASCGTSRWKGVYWNRREGKWIAEIMHDGHRFFLGQFTSEIDAAAAYDEAAKDRFGEFACLNAPVT